MGNYRFRLLDMIPNAWYYKLKDMRRTKNHNTSHHHSTKNKSTSKSPPPQKNSHLSQSRRYSYYFTTEPNRTDELNYSPVHPKASDTHFPENPRRLSTRRANRKAVYKPPPNKPVSTSSVAHCNCHEVNTIQSPDYFGSSSGSSSQPDFHELIPSEFECKQFGVPDPFDRLAPWSSSYNCRVSSSTSDTIIDKKNEGPTNEFDDHDQKLDEFDMIAEMELPSILTKSMKFDDHHKDTESTKFKRSSSKLKETKGQRSLAVKIVKEESIRTQKGNQKKTNLNSVRKSFANSTGIRLRGNSPRLASKKTQPCARKSVSSSSPSCLKSKNRRLSESFAVVKSSIDPQRDFMDSMMEMIVENNIRESKDLEDLLACYLSLNSNEYHDLIVKAFEQIWFDVADK